jgi:hypothetical protein
MSPATTTIEARLEPYGPKPTQGPQETIEVHLDAVDLFQVASERAQYARENIDQILWEVDSDESKSWKAIAILGEVNDRLRSL